MRNVLNRIFAFMSFFCAILGFSDMFDFCIFPFVMHLGLSSMSIFSNTYIYTSAFIFIECTTSVCKNRKILYRNYVRPTA